MKIKILVLGFSRIFQKRVFPALKKNSIIESIFVASVSKKIPDDILIEKKFNNYDEAINNFDGGYIYVSLSNNLHDEYVLKSLKSGFNVIVDKPAIIYEKTLDEINLLVNSSNLSIFESSVFSYHPVFKYLKKVIKENEINKIFSFFKIPLINNKDFRFQNIPGSGAEYDMSVYSLGFFNSLMDENVENIELLNMTKLGNITKSFDLKIKSKSGINFYGFYGFDSEYEHSVFIIGKNIKIRFERIFSLPSDIKLVVTITKENKVSEKIFLETDIFSNFFNHILNSNDSNIKNNSLKTINLNFNNLKILKSKINDYEKNNFKN